MSDEYVERKSSKVSASRRRTMSRFLFGAPKTDAERAIDAAKEANVLRCSVVGCRQKAGAGTLYCPPHAKVRSSGRLPRFVGQTIDAPVDGLCNRPNPHANGAQRRGSRCKRVPHQIGARMHCTYHGWIPDGGWPEIAL